MSMLFVTKNKNNNKHNNNNNNMLCYRRENRVMQVKFRYVMKFTATSIQYNNVIYRALLTKRPGVLTQLAVICTAK